jgi:hypothetical protein
VIGLHIVLLSILIVYHLDDWQHLHSTVGIRFTILSLAFTLLVYLV